MSQYDVIFVGSGIASLTAAAILAKKGKSVCVLEQHVKSGGYLHCFNRFGIRFDTGSHYIGSMHPGQTFHTLLGYLGVYDPSLFIELDPEGYDVFQFPEFKIAWPQGYAATVERLSAHFPESRSGIESYFKKVYEVVQEFPTYVFRSEYDEQVVGKSLEVSLQAVVESLIQDRNLQALLYAYCSIHGTFPKDTPFGLHALVTDSMMTGAFGFRKGGDALTQRYVDVITKAGGKVMNRVRVEKLLVENKNISRVQLSNGDSLSAEWIISGIHPKSTFRLLEPCELKPAFKSRLSKMKESEGIFGIYAYSNEAPKLDPLKNYYYFGSNHPDEFLSVSNPDHPPGAVFLTRTHREPESTLKFPLTFHSAGPLRWFNDWQGSQFNRRPSEYFALKKKVAGEVFKFVDQYERGLSGSIADYECSTPLSNLHFNGSEEGSAYGVYHSFENTGWRALGPRTHITNLLLTGQSTLMPGLLGAAVSGLRSAGHIVGIKPLLKELADYRGAR